MGILALKIARIAGWLLTAAITVLSIVPPELRPETSVPHNFEHFAIYFSTGIAFGFGYSRRAVTVAITLVIFTGAIEIVQIFIAGRHARWIDFIIDALALCVGIAVTCLVGIRTSKHI